MGYGVTPLTPYALHLSLIFSPLSHSALGAPSLAVVPVTKTAERVTVPPRACFESVLFGR